MHSSSPNVVTVAVLVREPEHHSLRLYRDAMFKRLPARGIELHTFAEGAPPPNGFDLVWDPGLGMRSVPPRLADARSPLVVTVLGLRSFAVPAHLLCLDADGVEKEEALKNEVRESWSAIRPKIAATLTISRACAVEVAMYLGEPPERIHAIHLAVERSVFRPEPAERRRHLLHVSLNPAARKNLGRILAAYDRLPRFGRIPLVLKLHEPLSDSNLPRGVRVVTGFCDDSEMARLYRRARGLVFPSIYEGFGLPIVEAMSCGCPVITSDRGACAEVAGGAALLVDPLSVDAISEAMLRLRSGEVVRDLSARGLKRADDFSWDRCADEHAALFRRITARAV